MPNSKNTKPVDDTPDKDEAAPPPEAQAEIEAEPIAAPLGPTMGRSALGVKEVIPFSWKVVGRSGDVILTLFKSIERADADAQLNRLQSEGYYTELAILENSAVVVQPKVAEPPKSKKTKSEKQPPPPEKSSKAPAAAAAKKPEKHETRHPAKAAAKSHDADRKSSAKPAPRKKESAPKKQKPAAKPARKK